MTTLSSDVESALGSLSEQLETLETDLRTGLGALEQTLSGPLSRQWNVTAVEGYGTDLEDFFPYEIPVADLVRWNGEEFAQTWAPTRWVPLVMVIPGVSPTAEFYSWTNVENPDATAARAKFDDSLPQFMATTDSTVRDVRDLVELPRTLGSFYTQWDAARAKMDSVPGRIDEALQLANTGLTWSGPGYESYGVVAARQKQIAEAVRSGINDTLEDVVGFVGLSMDVVNTLKSAADTLKSGVINASQNLLGVLASPKDWLGVVNLLVDAFQEGDRLRSEAAITGANNLASIIQHQSVIDRHFSALRGAAGVSSMDEVSWPQPADDMSLSWNSTHRT